jgi:hypothetical protein
MKVYEILTEAKKLVRNRERWTKGAAARNKKGSVVATKSEEAVSWCINGALYKVNGSSKGAGYIIQAARELYPHSYRFSSINGVNDGVNSHTQLMTIVNRAIEIAKEDERA